MAEERYIFVVMDSAGGLTRRYGVRKKLLWRIAGSAGAFLLCGALLLIHAVYAHELPSDSRTVALENSDLRATLVDRAVTLEKLGSGAAHTHRVARQVFQKAGLEREASLLAAGPLSSENSLTSPAADTSPPAPGSIAFDSRRIHELNDSLDHLVEYFRDADRLLLNTPSINPSPAGWFTSKYGMRIHPVHGKRMMHKGQDIAGPIGLKVFAPADGVVIWAANRGGYGRTIVLDHGYGLQTHFAHLDAYKVKVGNSVRRGDLIGLMGNTGISTGPHLHYEVRRNGRPLDPMDFILD